MSEQDPWSQSKSYRVSRTVESTLCQVERKATSAGSYSLPLSFEGFTDKWKADQGFRITMIVRHVLPPNLPSSWL